MKQPARIVAWVLPLALSGCFLHRPHQAKQPSLAPSLKMPPAPKPEMAPVELPPSVANIPTHPVPTIPTESLPVEGSKPSGRRRKATARPPEPAPPAPPTPEVSAIGQLSSGDPYSERRQTESSIAATEYGLDHIGRNLNSQEQKTAVHIREFLKQAHQALTSGDVDGAHTLAAKASVLLDELSR